MKRYAVQATFNLRHEPDGAAYLKVREKRGRLHPQLSPGLRFYRAHLMDTTQEIEVCQWETDNQIDSILLRDRLMGFDLRPEQVSVLRKDEIFSPRTD